MAGILALPTISEFFPFAPRPNRCRNRGTAVPSHGTTHRAPPSFPPPIDRRGFCRISYIPHPGDSPPCTKVIERYSESQGWVPRPHVPPPERARDTTRLSGTSSTSAQLWDDEIRSPRWRGWQCQCAITFIAGD